MRMAGRRGRTPSLSGPVPGFVLFDIPADMKSPVVSIVVPMYNAEKTIRKCLGSIPDRPDVQVVIVDDASTDGCASIASDFCLSRKSQDIRMVRLSENSGEGAARNKGMSLCLGEYIHSLDSDDWLIDGVYDKVVDSLPGCAADIVYIDLEVNDGSVIRLNASTKHTYCAFQTKFIRRSLTTGLRCREVKEVGIDLTYNEELQSLPHTEKFTGIAAYHYNFPRVGSMLWNLNNGKGYNEP